MFWLGSVNGTAGLPFFTQIRFQLKHRCWGKLSRTTRSRRREQPFSLFLSFHTLPNLVQKRVRSGAQQSSCTHPSIHPPIRLFIPPSHPYVLSLSVLLLFQSHSGSFLCVRFSRKDLLGFIWAFSLGPAGVRLLGRWSRRQKSLRCVHLISSASMFPFYQRVQLNGTQNTYILFYI